jgi:hypothetical protein
LPAPGSPACRSPSDPEGCEVAPEDWAAGDVRLDGEPIPYDAANGWTMTDGRTMELRGEACRRFLEAADPTLVAEWPCGTIIG